jgi:hypothetical protein
VWECGRQEGFLEMPIRILRILRMRVPRVPRGFSAPSRMDRMRLLVSSKILISCVS